MLIETGRLGFLGFGFVFVQQKMSLSMSYCICSFSFSFFLYLFRYITVSEYCLSVLLGEGGLDGVCALFQRRKDVQKSVAVVDVGWFCGSVPCFFFCVLKVCLSSCKLGARFSNIVLYQVFSVDIVKCIYGIYLYAYTLIYCTIYIQLLHTVWKNGLFVVLYVCFRVACLRNQTAIVFQKISHIISM